MFMIIFIITMLTVDYFEINETWFLICLVTWYRFNDELKKSRAIDDIQ